MFNDYTNLRHLPVPSVEERIAWYAFSLRVFGQ